MELLVPLGSLKVLVLFYWATLVVMEMKSTCWDAHQTITTHTGIVKIATIMMLQSLVKVSSITHICINVIAIVNR